MGMALGDKMCVCVYMCACVRQKERVRVRERERAGVYYALWHTRTNPSFLSSFSKSTFHKKEQ
uniref:Uncharacterized protein n=1 Tax=Anguilla anguilla TaxID=7936 RepID=A0A0E9Q336_ANGAN